MAPKPKVKEPPALASTLDNDAAAKFFSLVRVLSQDESFDTLENIDRKNKALTIENNDLRVANETNLQSFIQHGQASKDKEIALQKDLEDEKTRGEQASKDKVAAEKALKLERAEVAKLRARVDAQSKENKRLVEAVEDKDSRISLADNRADKLAETLGEADRDRADMGKKLASTKEQLEGLNSQLEKAEESLALARSFLQPLDKLEDCQNRLIQALDDTFKSAASIFQTILVHDLDEALLSPEANKSSISPTHNFAIPLPPTNSPAAKRMRVAAALMACGMALTTYVFRRTYLSLNGELEKLLAYSATEQPSQETHIRAALLKLHSQKQQENQEHLVNLAAGDILQTVNAWIPTSQRKDAKNRIKALCTNASVGWQLAQHTQERIRPDFVFKWDEDWNPLPDLLTDLSPSRSEGKQGQKMQNANDIACKIWPAILHSDPQQPESSALQSLLSPGYVLTFAQIQEARDEISQRSRRKLTREGSAAKKRKEKRDSAVFLFPTEGVGSDAK